ncbi:hypothetical protein BCR44DRAFT_177989 [Catenaria anguillulae PL171]|uniref:Uncharacterized protein n=1 Tax=Catenaria anguillulae PL171 TaxID=765915 RepID=A0A1Y2H7F1_9FUNG|nr:hypothetical protein BCR44DRAFT_177989 [Catenaria anguillulae PL171]
MVLSVMSHVWSKTNAAFLPYLHLTHSPRRDLSSKGLSLSFPPAIMLFPCTLALTINQSISMNESFTAPTWTRYASLTFAASLPCPLHLHATQLVHFAVGRCHRPTVHYLEADRGSLISGRGHFWMRRMLRPEGRICALKALAQLGSVSAGCSYEIHTGSFTDPQHVV